MAACENLCLFEGSICRLWTRWRGREERLMHVFGELRSPPDACCNGHTKTLKWPPTLGKVPVLPVGSLPACWNWSFLLWNDFCTFDLIPQLMWKYSCSFDLGWPWPSPSKHVSLLWPQRLSVVVSSLQELQSRNLWKVTLVFWTWNGTETNLTLTDRRRLSAGDSYSSRTHHKHAAWSCFSSTLLIWSGHQPPLEFREGKCTCWFAREIAAQKHSYLWTALHFALCLNISVSQPALHFLSPELTVNELRIILMTHVYALPGHICIYYIAELQTISITKAIANCCGTHKPLILISSLVDETLEKWILFLGQKDISRILWACQGGTERCAGEAVFVSLRTMLEAEPATPIDHRTIINIHESPVCNQELTGFPPLIFDQ